MGDDVRFRVRMMTDGDPPVLVVDQALSLRALAALRRRLDGGWRPPKHGSWCRVCFTAEFCADSLVWLEENRTIQDWIDRNLEQPTTASAEAAGEPPVPAAPRPAEEPAGEKTHG